MKKLLYICILLLLANCSSTQLVDHWRNPDIGIYEPYKVLVVGLTSDYGARDKFETKLKNELELRGSEAVMGLNVLDQTPKTDKMTEDELIALESQLIADGFDTILFTKIIGVEDKIKYRKNYKGRDETYRKFKDEYLMYQDVFFNPDYYEDYKIYKAETSMYCICPTKDRELIWKGYIDITDPESIEKAVNDYVRLVIVVLEEEQLINRINTQKEDIKDAVVN
ncbi:hypothetical protein [uncultured Psychroserpens sp.]|uniref:hypothetical protein n=1 Tax=uncultured Psychroserpens sp. TaxID=255436 RepID=UPI002622887A|nr:hypothetical protein [uncultured Psychroserpens sp.]